MALLIGMDIGTTGVKSILINTQGKILARDFQEYPLYLPRPGWAEQEAEDWWQATIKGLRSLLAKSKANPRDIKGLSFSGQMHGLVCLDKHLKPLRRAILWCDQRTTNQCRYITRKIGQQRLFKLVYNPALEGFTLPKLIWVRDREPKIYRQIHKILLPKDYVRFRLTGELGMEYSDAAGTITFDVAKCQWSQEILKRLNIAEDILPPAYRSIDIAGEITAEAAKATGLRRGMPVVFGGADNACAAVGNGIIEEGLLAVSIGTSGTVIAPTRRVITDAKCRIHMFNHAVPKLWYLMGVMQAAGLSFKWFRDNFASAEKFLEAQTGHDAYEYLIQEAATAPPGSEGLLWLPYLQGERTPHLDANARGVLFGLTARHNRSHVIRSILEGVVYGLRNSLDIIKSLGVKIDEIRLTGGGAKSALWRQIQADVFNAPVVTINIDEGPAFGAALIAGVGTGVFKSFKQASQRIIKVVECREPVPENAKIYEKNYRLYNRLYPALKQEFKKLSQLG